MSATRRSKTRCITSRPVTFAPAASVGAAATSTASGVTAKLTGPICDGLGALLARVVWRSYRWSTLSQVAYFRSEVNYDGHLVGGGVNEPPTDLLTTAHANGVTVALTFIPVGVQQERPQQRAAQLPCRRAAQEMVDKVVAVGADSINIDFEGVTQGGSCRPTAIGLRILFARSARACTRRDRGRRSPSTCRPWTGTAPTTMRAWPPSPTTSS
ncbi:MAG: hypothetical protein U0514_00320 [Candidatus Andersenbacteria bacterium]